MKQNLKPDTGIKLRLNEHGMRQLADLSFFLGAPRTRVIASLIATEHQKLRLDAMRQHAAHGC